MQHQYWVTKQAVLKKLGSKEDECIVTSDAELDAKLELFRSISDSCTSLQRIIDQYQERICILAQEESALGRYLRDVGRSGDGAGKLTAIAGKAFCYVGQQRHSSRNSLLRLHHEVETFRGRAVADARVTISAMEKARIEYRAALSWMKAASGQLDPDTGHGLHKFRKAQAQVRESKRVFDKLKLDCLQKVDLLAAARCNMFSHGLVNYQTTFLSFANKVAKTQQSTTKLLAATPQYEFAVLKELSQNPQNDPPENESKDKDQLLFFKDEYKDDKSVEKKTGEKTSAETLIEMLDSTEAGSSNACADLAGLSFGADSDNMFDFLSPVMPSQLLQDSQVFANAPAGGVQMSTNHLPNPTPAKKQDIERKDMSAWYQIFAELDPIANHNTLMPMNANTQSEA